MQISKHALSLQLLLLCCSLTAWSQLPEDFYDEVLPHTFQFPTCLAFDQQGRMYVSEKSGKVLVMDTTGQLLPEPLIDISEEVADWKDHGLMSFALADDFLSSGHFYLYYAVDLHHHYHHGTPSYNPNSTVLNHATFGRVTRYTADAATGFSTALPHSRRVLLGEDPGSGIPILYEFHGLGTLITGTDGTLLLSAGDATGNEGLGTGGDSTDVLVGQALALGIITPDQDIGSYRAQYLGNSNGKVLRIDPETGDGLASNPWFDPANPRSSRSRTWALGLRNPYRMCLLPGSGSHTKEDGQPGTIYIGDVGNGSWEEVNIARQGGQNFAWPIYEGYHLMWAFYLRDVPLNPMSPNDLYAEDGCTKPFFDFRELLLRPRHASDSLLVPHPCAEGEYIPPSAFPMMESLPALAWNNSLWNQPVRTEIGEFDGNGYVGIQTLGEAGATVSGDSFDGFSAMSGVFYQGEHFPEQYRGKFFCIDFSGWIKVFDFDEAHRLLGTAPFHDNAQQIIHLAQNPADGSLYYSKPTGKIHRISYGGNPPPVAIIRADKTYGPGPLTVQLDGSASYDNKYPLVDYAWDFGDGHTASGALVSHQFEAPSAAPHRFDVSLTVTDSLGLTGNSTQIISLNNTPPLVHISSVADSALYPMNATSSLELLAEVTDLEHPDGELSYEWSMFLHHNTHFHKDPPDHKHRTFALIAPLGCQEELYWYRIELQVTDPAGLQGSDSREIFPDCAPPFLVWSGPGSRSRPDHVLVSWGVSTASETEIFEVQRSQDGLSFEPIGLLPAPQTDGEDSYLEFQDFAPLHGTNIYRIKALAADSRAFLYSPTTTTEYPPVQEVKLYPNPFRQQFNLTLDKSWGENVRLELFNVLGQPVFKAKWPAIYLQPFAELVSVGGLSAGYYTARVSNGEYQHEMPLIVQP